MDNVISSYVKKLTEQYPAIHSIWLFGSRANGTAKETSDWDLFVFGNEQGLVSLRNNSSLKNDYVDILFVVN
ncbi:MAG: nucleotidyltransferase domain-containing protein, partial [Thermodesulfovibrionales bacterium]|nr:nucleotidyltransferase domain-containing protein [Thermodesulfovibrionales bacterium]